MVLVFDILLAKNMFYWLKCHLQLHSKLIYFFFTFQNLPVFYEQSGYDTVDEVAPEDAADEGAGEEEVEDGDSHPPNSNGKA